MCFGVFRWVWQNLPLLKQEEGVYAWDFIQLGLPESPVYRVALLKSSRSSTQSTVRALLGAGKATKSQTGNDRQSLGKV